MHVKTNYTRTPQMTISHDLVDKYQGPVSQRVLDLAKFLAKSWT